MNLGVSRKISEKEIFNLRTKLGRNFTDQLGKKELRQNEYYLQVIGRVKKGKMLMLKMFNRAYGRGLDEITRSLREFR